VTPHRIRIGTRGSDLALWQARHVEHLLGERWGSEVEVAVAVITTEGDRIQDRPLHEVGGKGLFVKAIEKRLLAKEIDLAVHSMKDLPSRMPGGLVIACTPAREDPRDVLLGRSSTPLSDLPAGTRLGTGSLRRGALARRGNPAIEIVPIRGNVPTRVRKVEAGEVDVALLAAAGLKRLGLADRITQYLEVESFCPAPCQGILAVQCRADDSRTMELAEALSDASTAVQAAAERAFLRRLDADCTVPLGCHAALSADGSLTVRGLVVHPSGRPCYSAIKVGDRKDADRLGVELAEALLRLGAQEVIDGS